MDGTSFVLFFITVSKRGEIFDCVNLESTCLHNIVMSEGNDLDCLRAMSP